jgi:hypothetical protein
MVGVIRVCKATACAERPSHRTRRCTAAGVFDCTVPHGQTGFTAKGVARCSILKKEYRAAHRIRIVKKSNQHDVLNPVVEAAARFTDHACAGNSDRSAAALASLKQAVCYLFDEIEHVEGIGIEKEDLFAAKASTFRMLREMTEQMEWFGHLLTCYRHRVLAIAIVRAGFNLSMRGDDKDHELFLLFVKVEQSPDLRTCAHKLQCLILNKMYGSQAGLV